MIIVSDLNGGMIKLSDVISVNQAVKLENYEVRILFRIKVYSYSCLIYLLMVQDTQIRD